MLKVMDTQRAEFLFTKMIFLNSLLTYGSYVDELVEEFQFDFLKYMA